MDFNGFTLLPDLTPRIDTSFIDEMNRRNQEMLDSITPLNEILAEEIRPILEGNQKVERLCGYEAQGDGQVPSGY